MYKIKMNIEFRDRFRNDLIKMILDYTEHLDTLTLVENLLYAAAMVFLETKGNKDVFKICSALAFEKVEIVSKELDKEDNSKTN